VEIEGMEVPAPAEEPILPPADATFAQLLSGSTGGGFPGAEEM
jgi:hypothetical protein